MFNVMRKKEIGGKRPLLRTSDDLFKFLVLSNQQTKSKIYSFFALPSSCFYFVSVSSVLLVEKPVLTRFHLLYLSSVCNTLIINTPAALNTSFQVTHQQSTSPAASQLYMLSGLQEMIGVWPDVSVCSVTDTGYRHIRIV